MSERAKVAEFVSFCIEMFARKKNLSGGYVASLCASCGALDYLSDCYDVLHTQGASWLVADIEDYLKSRGIAA